MKICLFFLSFVIYFIINALLFTKETIHKIYKDGGKYNLYYALPKIIICFIISYIISGFIKYISLSERYILEVKYEETYEKADDKADKVKKCFIIKNSCFFILSIIFLILFWYYLSSFCAVYKNSQIYLIENTLICFGISFLFPFIYYLIPIILRICSLKKRNKSMEFIYRISLIIQFI